MRKESTEETKDPQLEPELGRLVCIRVSVHVCMVVGGLLGRGACDCGYLGAYVCICMCVFIYVDACLCEL